MTSRRISELDQEQLILLALDGSDQQHVRLMEYENQPASKCLNGKSSTEVTSHAAGYLHAPPSRSLEAIPMRRGWSTMDVPVLVQVTEQKEQEQEQETNTTRNHPLRGPLTASRRVPGVAFGAGLALMSDRI